VTQGSQAAVALTAEALVREVMDLEPPRLAAALAAAAGLCDRARSPDKPVR
jgi:hypothetical protein